MEITFKIKLFATIIFMTFCVVGWALLPVGIWLYQLLIDNPLFYAIWCFIVYAWMLYRLK